MRGADIFKPGILSLSSNGIPPPFFSYYTFLSNFTLPSFAYHLTATKGSPVSVYFNSLIRTRGCRTDNPTQTSTSCYDHYPRFLGNGILNYVFFFFFSLNISSYTRTTPSVILFTNSPIRNYSIQISVMHLHLHHYQILLPHSLVSQ